MTGVTRSGARKWTNEHRSLRHRMDRVVSISQVASADCVADLQERRAVLGALVADEAANGHALAVTGSSWSQSKLIARDATWVDTGDDQAIWELPNAAFREGIDGRHRYVLVAGGTRIDRLMAWLEDEDSERRLSLVTAGSHKGQSVAGMLATGSHGSIIGRSGFECHVRAMLVATGRDAAQWLASEPVLRDEFVSQFATIADPALFASALVHLGGMGLVSAVLLEVEDQFHLGRVKRARALPPDWAQFCAAGDFRAATGSARNPAYYEVTLDPFRGPAHEALESIWYRNEGEPLMPVADPHERHLLDVMGDALVESYAQRLGKAANEGMIDQWLVDVPEMTWEEFKAKDVADEPDAHYRLSQLVIDWKPHEIYGLRIDVYNAAFAVPLDRLPEALEIAFALGQGDDPKLDRDFVYTVRFADRSPAAMGFLRFERNAIINIDGLSKHFAWGWSDSDDAALELAERFEKAGLPFSMHWGKDASSDAAKIAHDFGNAVQAYRTARATLLGENAKYFGSPALTTWGLA